jgi:hypothetical protein
MPTYKLLRSKKRRRQIRTVKVARRGATIAVDVPVTEGQDFPRGDGNV